MKTHAVIVGSGNIGTDLLMKMQRSNQLRALWVVGIDAHSEGLKKARKMGVKTTHNGVEDFVQACDDDVTIAFDATSAYAHRENYRLLEERGITVVDMTPAAIGPYCIPPVNLDANIREPNVNMVTCGGQATIPIVAAVSQAQPVAYAEIVATIASRSAGPGTRRNIDEFTRTTAHAIEKVGGAKRGKAIIILNPADPPIMMRDTVHCLTVNEPDKQSISQAITKMVAAVRQYVPGYRVANGPVFDGNRVTVFLEVEGLGDFLPRYAGNLDIMTAAALRTGELIASKNRMVPEKA